MTPQSLVYVTAPIASGKVPEVRRLLDAMNVAPGRVRPDNPLFPFAAFDTIHFARWLVVDDNTRDDALVYGLSRPDHPPELAFVAEVDGDLDAFLAEVAAKAGPGVAQLFGCCDGFVPGGDLAAWLKAHHVKESAGYVNWLGRTVTTVREESALYDAVRDHLRREWPTLGDAPPARVHQRLRELVWADVAAGRLRLSPETPTPLGWRLRKIAHAVLWPLVLLVLSPVLVPVAIAFVIIIRRMEPNDPETCQRGEPRHVANLAAVEDFDVTNSFTVTGSLKPGRIRRWTMTALLGVVDYAARHVYTRGRLARIRTIHFARWVLLGEKTRGIFFSNYDGSLESYMDDFINKVFFGLNVSFGQALGYPRTVWLAFGGAAEERKFKEYLRRHQIPTQVWYKAYPGLTALDVERHGRIRAGLESASLGGRAAAEWVELL